MHAQIGSELSRLRAAELVDLARGRHLRPRRRPTPRVPLQTQR